MKNTRIIVVIEGGVCQGVFSTDENIEVGLLDYDNMKEAEADEAHKEEHESYKQYEKEIKNLKQIF